MDGASPPDTADARDLPSPDGWDLAPPVLRPRRRLPKWPFVLAGVILTLGVAVALAWPVNVPYYALAPGPVNDVTDYIDVPDPAPETGDLFFLTVTLKEVNLLEYVAAWLDDEVDLNRRETIRPAGVSQEELRAQNLSLMEQSKQNALFVALSQLGYEVTFEGTGAMVTSVIEQSAADGRLEENDVIVGVNGSLVEFSTDAVELIGGFTPGDTVTVSIKRSTATGEIEEMDLSITLGPFLSEDDEGNIVRDMNRGMIGVVLTNAPTNIVFPVAVTIDSQNIGGPSAGLMFTLEIINQLSEQDVTRGHRIAGTGTIDREGSVGAIGGARQKVFAAIDVGADYVFVPAANFAAAETAARDDIQVVSIASIDDALAFLATLPVA